MRILPLLCCFLLLKAAEGCADVGQQSLACDGAKGNKPSECCVSLTCEGKWCVADGGGGGGGGGGSCPMALKVSCILWATTGGKGQHLHAIVAVQDENDDPVGGATVTMNLSRDGDYYAPGKTATTYTGGSSSTLNSYPDLTSCPGTVKNGAAYGITPAQCVNKATPGNYKIEVTDISLDGCGDADFDINDSSNTKMRDYDGPVRKLRSSKK